MKTFRQFCEDAAHDYETGMKAYEKLGAVKRKHERHRASSEAERREAQGKRFTLHNVSSATTSKHTAQQKFAAQNQAAKNARIRGQAERHRQREKTAKIAHDVKTAGKTALQLTKKLVKSVRNRTRGRDQ